MLRTRSIRITAAAASGLLAGAWTCAAQQPVQKADLESLQATIRELQTKNADLERSLVQANRNEKEASDKLARIQQRLTALGHNLLDGGNDRLVQAASNLEVMQQRLADMEGASSRFAFSVSEYLRQAVAADPEARMRVETSMRDLDEIIGVRQKAAPQPATGTAGQAKIVSIDAESGLLVLNIGENQTARIGTTYHLVRNDQPFGTAIVADVRRNVSGAFVEQLDQASGPVRAGDTALLITQPGR